MQHRDTGARRSRRGSAAFLALAALALPAAMQASTGGAGIRQATAAGERSAPAREVVFVVDLSEAMRGESLERAKAELTAALERLRPGDTFNVLALGERTRALFPASWPVGPASLDRAARWIAGLETDGSAGVLNDLAAALGPPDQGYSTPGARPVREVIVYAPGAIGGATAGGLDVPAASTRAASAGSPVSPDAPAHTGPDRRRLDGAGPAAEADARTGGRASGAAGRSRAGGVTSLLLRLGGGLAVFAAALAYALRRGLAAPEAAR